MPVPAGVAGRMYVCTSAAFVCSACLWPLGMFTHPHCGLDLRACSCGSLATLRLSNLARFFPDKACSTLLIAVTSTYEASVHCTNLHCTLSERRKMPAGVTWNGDTGFISAQGHFTLK